ncbi:hypothetical protein EWM64_g3819 [Hericium alpestre]|uniref:Uncharacterized protein n=1 Tax=Hericium alpestre TaxID=135208 RepID=A0A4Y9ZZ84_9AGAM|nr:hypothetical protein EWM64_g3819 [Hericium alpestre]
MDSFTSEIILSSSSVSHTDETQTNVPADQEASGSGGHSYCIVA